MIVCDCGRAARGWTPEERPAPEHYCRQCSPQHCLMQRHFREKSAPNNEDKYEMAYGERWSGVLPRSRDARDDPYNR